MSAMRESFITEAERLLRLGKPYGALEMLYRFPAATAKGEDLRDDQYWTLRSIGNFLIGDKTEGLNALDEIKGGLTQEFLDEYKLVLTKFAGKRPSRIKRRRTTHYGLVLYNIGQIMELAREIDHYSAYDIGQDIAGIVPRR